MKITKESLQRAATLVSSREHFQSELERLIHNNEAGDFHQALMSFGCQDTRPNTVKTNNPSDLSALIFDTLRGYYEGQIEAISKELGTLGIEVAT